ncbi:MAG: orotidine-5'-phosphate decarboxylase [Candidatus Omnitrophica bacterium CG_4_9_14_0_2_um_filter_42_8]|nr:MAG: orotidine-5'-phosphate decarboxylase [Candidatus Omnitrophica bacterium CG22_combo_CG10-13_8_21_14_all_43_16]PJC48189.1 MAG: orotidine-5'-phosphate decarboxylase [Candidatus Omnitrophica bacterium CG_4_9_14_0_2_um_filter_42_8]
MKDKIIVALDVNTLKEEERLLDILSPHVQVFKIGMELFYSCGLKTLELVKKHDRDIFLDLKFHDIPNTVYAAAKTAVRFEVFMFNVHASGGIDMMQKAVEGAEEESEKLGISRPKILGVTVLTSMDSEALKKIGINKSPEDQVLNLAKLTKEAGLDGVVASPEEISAIRKTMGKDFLIVTPGVRPEDSDSGDQKRVATPKEAFQRGADYIVIGRPVTKAKDPVKVIQSI